MRLSFLILALFSLIVAVQAAKEVQDTKCACRNSISLPKLQPQYIYNGTATPFLLAVNYDKDACRYVNFHVKLEGADGNGNVGCLVEAGKDTADTGSFRPTTDVGSGGTFVRGGDGQNNKCGLTSGEICSKLNTPLRFAVTADGCELPGITSGSDQKPFTNYYSFKCISGPSVSQSSSFKKREERVLGIPPRYMRCPIGSQACKTGGTLKTGFKWDCLQNDSIDSCGGCPGEASTQDCTELPGISAVQCVAKQCLVASCRKGFKLVDNACVPIEAPSKSNHSSEKRGRKEGLAKVVYLERKWSKRTPSKTRK